MGRKELLNARQRISLGVNDKKPGITQKTYFKIETDGKAKIDQDLLEKLQKL